MHVWEMGSELWKKPPRSLAASGVLLEACVPWKHPTFLEGDMWPDQAGGLLPGGVNVNVRLEAFLELGLAFFPFSSTHSPHPFHGFY